MVAPACSSAAEGLGTVRASAWGSGPMRRPAARSCSARSSPLSSPAPALTDGHRCSENLLNNERQLIDVVIGAPSARRIAKQLDRSRLVERAIVREMLEHVRLYGQRSKRYEPHREAPQRGSQQAVIVG